MSPAFVCGAVFGFMVGVMTAIIALAWALIRDNNKAKGAKDDCRKGGR